MFFISYHILHHILHQIHSAPLFTPLITSPVDTSSEFFICIFSWKLSDRSASFDQSGLFDRKFNAFFVKSSYSSVFDVCVLLKELLLLILLSISYSCSHSFSDFWILSRLAINSVSLSWSGLVELVFGFVGDAFFFGDGVFGSFWDSSNSS